MEYAPKSPRAQASKTFSVTYPDDSDGSGAAAEADPLEDHSQLLEGTWEVKCTYRGRINHSENAPLRMHTAHDKHFRESLKVADRVNAAGALDRNHRRKASKILSESLISKKEEAALAAQRSISADGADLDGEVPGTDI